MFTSRLADLAGEAADGIPPKSSICSYNAACPASCQRARPARDGRRLTDHDSDGVWYDVIVLRALIYLEEPAKDGEGRRGTRTVA